MSGKHFCHLPQHTPDPNHPNSNHLHLQSLIKPAISPHSTLFQAVRSTVHYPELSLTPYLLLTCCVLTSRSSLVSAIPISCDPRAPPDTCQGNTCYYQERGGGSVTNPVRGLPSDCHKRSPLHHIDSHTTQTVICHSGLQFPSSIALITHTHTHTHTAECTDYTYTAESNQTYFISLGLPLSDRRVLSSVYHSPSDSYITDPFRVF